MTEMTISISDGLAKAIKQAASEWEVPESEVITLAMSDWMRHNLTMIKDPTTGKMAPTFKEVPHE